MRNRWSATGRDIALTVLLCLKYKAHIENGYVTVHLYSRFRKLQAEKLASGRERRRSSEDFILVVLVGDARVHGNRLVGNGGAQRDLIARKPRAPYGLPRFE